MPETKASQRLKALLKVCGKSRAEVAEELDYPPHMVSMLAHGRSPIPLGKAGAIAEVIGADPGDFVRLVMEAYAPDALEAIREYVGELVSDNERELLRIVREASGGRDPELSTFQRGMIAAVFRASAS